MRDRGRRLLVERVADVVGVGMVVVAGVVLGLLVLGEGL